MNRETKIINKIIEMYPDAECELIHKNAFELLIATVLSAQTTDKQVNIVTQNLFAEFPTAIDMSRADIKDIKKNIKSLGFFNTKAENIKKTSKMLVDNFEGEVPSNMDDLVKLPGVGRKTANVVLSNAFNVPAFAVDTHVKRICKRLALTKSDDPDKVEIDITSKIPKKLYTKAHHAIIFHGRRVCKAINPSCDICELKKECNYYKTTKQ